jgi:RNA methyltransferase, TrmH family
MEAGYVLDLVRSARRDPARVRLEGVHALKHALRFGAHVEAVVTPDASELFRLLEDLAPDVVLPVAPLEVDRGTWAALAGRELPSPALSVARRPVGTPETVLAASGRVVVLEDPRHLGNVGAVIRVAAAAGAGGVLVVGAADPWHPTAVRGAAGLQFALRVARGDELPTTDRPVVALDPEGPVLGSGVVPDDAVLLFGTERGGLSSALLDRATQRIGIPMRPGVSSLNLATAVAVTLYA